MPAKPLWLLHLPAIEAELKQMNGQLLDRQQVQAVLGVGPRRAQQLMAPCTTLHLGTSSVVEASSLIGHLKRLAGHDEAYFEEHRRRKLADVIGRLRQDRIEHPQVVVETTVKQIVDQEIANLPPGVFIGGGRITLDFQDPKHALQQLAALAMAIGNDYDTFERIASITSSAKSV